MEEKGEMIGFEKRNREQQHKYQCLLSLAECVTNVLLDDNR